MLGGLTFGLFGFLGVFLPCQCDQRLLIDQLRWDFLEMENEMWNLSGNGLLHKSQSGAEVYLAKKFYDFDTKLKQIPENILYGAEPLRTMPNFLFLYSDLKSIEIVYQKFRDYLNQQLAGSKQLSIDDIIYDIANNKTGVREIMDKIYETAFEGDDDIKHNIYQMLTDNYWCKNTRQSPQQMLYNLYNLIALFDLKAYVLQQFAHIENRLWDKENNLELSVSTRRNYEKRVTNTINGLHIGTKYPRTLWRCDPKFFIKGRNYDEFTRLLQGHIQNEVDMSSKRTCRQTCSEYSYTKSYGCYDYKSDFCRKVESCNGNIIGCFFVESHASVCVSSSPSRRYENVRFKSGVRYGENTHCPAQRSVNSWTRWFVRCHYCMCLCDQTGPLSDRYVNLRPVMADVTNNRVVTGLRLVKHNRILHLQIQEGKLLPYGYVNASTVHWVQVNDYTITDPKILDGKDFFTLKYGERSMAMDNIDVNEDNHVITGVRFQFINSKIHFQIHVCPFNWHNGKVDHLQGYYIYNSHPGGRMKIEIKNPHVPTKTSSPSEMFQGNGNTYVEFTNSDFSKDAAQTTIPFFDTQEVVNSPAVPLVGAGVYYKGARGYGGFIAPLIKTYDYFQHMSVKMPAMDDRQDVEEDATVEVN